MSSAIEKAPEARIFNLGGVKVEFPPELKPYPSQLSLMSKAVTGARKAQNCLLESPTGSGKTMAMLCSLLAWQKSLIEEQNETDRAYRAQIEAQKVEMLESNDLSSSPMVVFPISTPSDASKATNKMQSMEEESSPGLNKSEVSLQTSSAVVDPSIATSSDTPKRTNRMQFMEEWSPELNTPQTLLQTSLNANGNTSCSRSPDLFDDDDDDMDAFKPPKKKKLFKTSDNQEKVVINLKGPTSSTTEKLVKVEIASPSITHSPPQSVLKNKPPPRIKIPKIYFTTRTHKQIAQVVSELRRTPYKDVRMTILSSREHSCIRQLEHPYTNKTEMCHGLMDGFNKDEEDRANKRGGCMFKTNMNKVLYGSNPLTILNVSTPWDIEDLVQAGKKKRCCPYFTSRELMARAEIIFCPYNYIIDPLIRRNMKISLQDNVIIFDEAHNIEDSIRSATSFSLEEAKLNDAIKSCKIAIFQGANSSAHQEVKRVLEIILAWMKESSENLKMESGISQERTCIWNGTQYIAHMDDKGIGSSHFINFKAAVDAILQGEEQEGSSQSQEENEGDEPKEEKTDIKFEQLYKPNQNFRIVVGGLTLIWSLMYKDESKHRDDYQVVLYETTSRYFAPEFPEGQSDGGWVRRSRVSAQAQLGVHFWCMNPALGFADFQAAHSVLVTSGTLSPMTSFQSELGVMFPHPLSADHVIDPSQAWVATIGVGPSNKTINGTYRNAITMEYQDEVGSAILKICQAVPFGVLCFFPSYAMLDNIMKRWQMTGKWKELVACKYVLKEPRKQGEFSEAMSEFDHAVRRAEVSAATDGFQGGHTGALFLAVFRGKLSEGIDFKDNHARAVITVSIPFPSMSDLNVKLKKKYNDRNNLSTRQLLPGNQWYEIQAYRAINQALGRCIRHRNDWGAIILLDNRFSLGSKSTSSLSKWATKRIKHFQCWDDMYPMLQDFMEKRLAIQNKNDAKKVKEEVATQEIEMIDLT